MDIEIKNKLLKIIRKIRTWDPEEDSAEMLLILCDEFDKIKPNSSISLDDWINIRQLGCATEYTERVDKKLSYPNGLVILTGIVLLVQANGILNI